MFGVSNVSEPYYFDVEPDPDGFWKKNGGFPLIQWYFPAKKCRNYIFGSTFSKVDPDLEPANVLDPDPKRWKKGVNIFWSGIRILQKSIFDRFRSTYMVSLQTTQQTNVQVHLYLLFFLYNTAQTVWTGHWPSPINIRIKIILSISPSSIFLAFNLW